jgi:hypothetical protein
MRLCRARGTVYSITSEGKMALEMPIHVEIVVRHTDGSSASLQISSDDLGKEDSLVPLP